MVPESKKENVDLQPIITRKSLTGKDSLRDARSREREPAICEVREPVWSLRGLHASDRELSCDERDVSENPGPVSRFRLTILMFQTHEQIPWKNIL